MFDASSGTEGASYENKRDFLGEAHLLSQFNHPNVLALLGVATVDEPVLVVIPFMKNGDLHAFLTRCVAVMLTYNLLYNYCNILELIELIMK